MPLAKFIIRGKSQNSTNILLKRKFIAQLI